MRIGRVTGALVSTKKHEKLHGAKLLLVQPVDPDGRASGTTVLAVDAAQAGIGDKVLLVIEGRAAGHAVRRRAAPIDAAIVGVIDSVTRYESD